VIRVAVAALLAAAVGVLALAFLWPAPAPPASPVAGPPPSARPSPALSGTDAAWLSLTIAMNDSTLVLLDRAAPRLTDDRLATFVSTLAVTHRAELADLRGRADRANLPITDEHAGHELPGIVTPADLARIEALPGAEFDAAVRECLREHLEQGARLAASEQLSGGDEATRQLAAGIERARRADLARLGAGPQR